LKRVILLIIYFIVIIQCYSQTNHSFNYTINDFLPDNNVREIFKDSKNNLWIGTDIGVIKISGTEKTHYTIDDGLLSNKVWSIVEDKDGVLWFACFQGGICKWNGHSFDTFATERELGDSKIRMLYYSKKNDILFAGGNYTFSRINGNDIKYFRNYITNPHVIVTNFLENDSVVFALTYGKHAWRYYPDIDTAIVISLYDTGSNYNRWYYSTSNIVLSNKDTIVSFHDKGINLFTQNGKVEYRGFGQVFEMFEENNKVWMTAWSAAASHVDRIGYRGGLYTFENGEINYKSDRFGIESERCWALWRDSINKQIYVGTNDKGLYILDDPIFTNYDANFFNEKELDASHIVCVGSDLYFNGNGNIIKWSNNGVDKLAVDKFHDTKRKMDSRIYNIHYANKSKKSKEVNYIFEINSHDKFLYINNKLGLFRTLLDDFGEVDYITNPEGKSIEFYGANFYSNTHSALWVYDTVNWEVINQIRMNKSNLYADEGQFRSVDTIFYAGKGRNTLYEIYSDSAHEIHIPDTLTGVVINDFLTEDGKTFFCAMRDGTLLKAIKNDTVWNWSSIEFPCKCGSSISWLLKKNEYIYFSTNLGFGSFMYEQDEASEFKFLTKEQGYNGEVSKEAVFGGNGNIFIPSNDRIIEVDIEQFHHYKNHLGELKLVNIEIEHKEADNELISLSKNEIIKLKYKENTFNLKFNITQPQITSKVKYQYILEGYQHNWSQPNEINLALFNRVPSGSYIFKIKAFTSTQPAEIIELEYPITILKPIYQTWLFRVVMIILMLLGIMWIIRRQRKKEFDKWQTSLQIKELEKQSLLSKINPHFLFNSLNSVQKFILNKQNDDAVLFLGKFSKLIRQTLENSVEDNVAIEKEIDLLKNYMDFEKNRCEVPFNYSISIDEQLDIEEAVIPPMLIQPFIENAIKHGVDHLKKLGNITLDFNILNEKVLQVKIIDDGIGREQSAKLRKEKSRSSLGVKLVNDRINLYNDVKLKEPIYKVEYLDLYDENNDTLGTKVSLFIPFFTF